MNPLSRLVLALFLTLGVIAVHATIIPGLFRSGVDDTNNPLPPGTVDPHYSLNGGSAMVAVANSSWITTSNANWLSVTADGEADVSDAIPYDYTTTFVLPADVVPNL